MSTRPLEHPPRAQRRSRVLRGALTGLVATGIAAALAIPAVAAPVGVPVPPGGHVTNWGENESWQLTPVPTPPAGQSFTAVAAGNFHSVALTTDGHITSWANDEFGQVTGSPTGGGFKAIAANSFHSLALTPDGHITRWGTWMQDAAPADGGFTAIAAGERHSVALTADGQLRTWGATVAPPIGSGYTAIAAGTGYSLALTADGHITAWADASYGDASGAPTDGGYTAIAAGKKHSLALTANGEIVQWGANDANQLDGKPAGSGFTAIAASGNYSLALTPDGHIVSWGNNNDGQISQTPTGGGFTSIAAGVSHALAIHLPVAPILTGAPPAATAGKAYSHAFTVTGFPAPSVTVTSGTLPPGLTLSEGGVLSGTPTTAETVSFTVTAANGIGAASVLPVTFQVVPVPDTSSFATLSASSQAKVGVPTSLYVAITGLPSGAPAPTGGTVDFKVDGVIVDTAPVVNGAVTRQYAFTAVGNYNLSAVYSGFGTLPPTTSNFAPVKVTAPDANDVDTTTVVTVPATAVTGTSVQLKANVSPLGNVGTVQFFAGDTPLGAPVNVSNGEAVLAHTFTSAGTETITAVFSGGPGLKASTSAPWALVITAAGNGPSGSLDFLGSLGSLFTS